MILGMISGMMRPFPFRNDETVPEEEEEDTNARKGLPNFNRTLVEKVSHLIRMTQQKI